MRFDFQLTVPANTTAASPATARAKMTKGRLIAAYIKFEAGCHNQVKIQVRDRLMHVIPAAGDTPLFGDNVNFRIPMSYELADLPFELTLYGWSPGTKYQHVITFAFDLDPTGGDERAAIFEMLFSPLKNVIPQ